MAPRAIIHINEILVKILIFNIFTMHERENSDAVNNSPNLENFVDKVPKNKNLSLIESFKAEIYAIRVKYHNLKH